MTQLRDTLGTINKQLQLARLESEQADTALLQNSSTQAAKLAQLASAALQARARLREVLDAQREAEQHLETATELMRNTANELAQCLVGKQPCDAQAAGVQLQTARQTVGLAAASKLLGKAPSKTEVQTMLELAAKSQDAVDKLRTKAAGVYDQADQATAAVLTTASAATPGAAASELAAQAKTWTKTALSHPELARKQVRQAQAAADIWVQSSLALQACEPSDTSCQQLHFAAASEGKVSFETARNAAKETLGALDQAQHGLESRKLDPDASPKAIANAIELRKLLQTNPDVKSFFGDDAIGLSAGNAGSNASIRWTMGNTQLLGRDRFSLIASTPKSDSEISGFLNEADKLKHKSSLAAVWHRTRSENRLLGDAIVDYSLGLTWARDERTYLEPSTPLSLVKTKARFNDWALNSQMAALLPGYKNLLLMSVDVQRVREDGPSAIRCPVDPSAAPALVTCTNGPLGMPTLAYNRAYNRVFSMELRSIFDKFGLGFKATHSREDNKLTLDMPIYLVRDLDNAKTPLTGGINFNWTKDGTGLKVGVFISAPLSLAKPDR